MKLITKWGLITFTILVLIISSLSCSKTAPDQKTPAINQTTAASIRTRQHPPVRTGEFTLGQKVDLVSQSISNDGGGVVVSKPGDPLDGFLVGVPPQSSVAGRTFKVSYAPVTKQTFGDDFAAASPLITVDNGGVYSDELMYVRVPVKIPEGYLAMGFLYDEKTKQLEGMPLITQDAGSITVATRHFSNFLIGMINRAKLKENVDSGFTPGIDDWQFTNYGSFIAPGGHCEGQSLSEMWYYCTQPDGKDYCLYGRYDNNGNQPSTPALWQDDSLGYRFVSTVHAANNSFIGTKGSTAYDTWAGLAGRAWKQVNNKWQWTNVPELISDGTTRDLFTFAIQMTGEPQLIKIQDDSGGGGHTMVVYKTVGNALYIADPNYPGNTDRKVIYYSGENKFKPYNSGANRAAIEAGKGVSYSHIMYFSKSTLVEWGTISKLWAEFKKGSIGNDKFPAYKIVYRDDAGRYQELTEGKTFNINKVLLGIDFNGTMAGLNIYRDGVFLQWDADGKYELKPGNNLLGVYVTKKIGNENLYVDFKYINVKFGDEPSGSLTIKPENENIDAGQKLVLTVTNLKPPAKPAYEWVVGSSELKLAPVSRKSSLENTFNFDYTDPGTYEVNVIESDATTAKPTGSTGKTTVVIKPKGFDRLGLLHKQAGIVLRLNGKHTYSDWAAPNTTTSTVRDEAISCPFNYNNELTVMPISWTGNSFAGKFTWGRGDNQRVYTVSGSISADGTTLTSLTSSYAEKSRGSSGGGDRTVKITTSNIPIWTGNTPSTTISGPDIAKYVTGISLLVNSDQTGVGKTSSRQYVASDWTKGSMQLGFSPTIDNYVTGSNGEFTAK
jgi:hypothetical protein